MPLRKLFRRIVIALFIALTLAGIFIYAQIYTLRTSIEQIVTIEEPLEKAVLEMEITVTEMSNAVLGFVSSNNNFYSHRLNELEKKFETHQQVFDKLKNSAKEEELGNKLSNVYQDFKSHARSIVAMHREQHDVLTKMLLIDSTIQSIPQYQLNNLKGYNPDKVKKILKIHKLNEELLVAMGSFILTKKVKDILPLRETKKVFDETKRQFLTLYPEEIQWFIKLDSNYRRAITLGYKVTYLEDDKERYKSRFKTQLSLIDDLLDHRIQPLIKQKNKSLLEKSRWASFLSVYFILITSVLALAIFLYMINLFRNTILKPILSLNEGAKEISKGNFDVDVKQDLNNEIGEFSITFTNMSQNLALSFAEIKELLANNEEITQELSVKNADLEQAQTELLSYQTELKSLVKERTQELEQERALMISSLNYAQRIQNAMLPLPELFKQLLPESFILFKPRDIVSGDFYWLAEKNNLTIVAAVDCTGHGVPGAFMSMIGNELLNEIITLRGVTDAGKILNQLHIGVSKALHQKETLNHDGMDMAICVIDKSKKSLDFAGAKNPIIYIQNKKTQVIKGDSVGIGGHFQDIDPTFTTHTISYENQSEPSSFYICSDGFQDQFGGETGRRKFMRRNLENLFLEIYEESFDKQKEILIEKFIEWKGENEQLDDVLIIGFKLV